MWQSEEKVHSLLFIIIIIFLFYFWLCWVFVSVQGLSPLTASGGHSSSWCAGLSLSWPLLLRSTGSRRAGSVVVAHGLSCSAAYGIFPDQGSNPCPLHWQADSQPLRHQGTPPKVFLSWVWCEHSWEQNMTWINRRLLPLWCILLSFIAEISMYLITGFWSRPNWKN